MVLLLTKPEDNIRTPDGDIRLSRMIHRHYPKAAEGLCGRAEAYNHSISLAEQYAKEGKLLIIAPDDTCGVTTLTRDRSEQNHQKLLELYRKGYGDGAKIREFLGLNR